MKISFNSLLEFAPIHYTPEQTADILTMLGIEVESIEFQRAVYDNFYIGEVTGKEKHPDAKKLSVCQVSTGSASRQIICGAPNVEAGQRVVVALPGAIVPSNGMTIGERPIRGVQSSGMICSEAELGISSDSDGIWVLPSDAVIGMSLADYLGKNDVIYDIGITANRADCLSHTGVARDLAAYSGVDFHIKTPEIIEDANNIIERSLKVEIINADKCPRYAARIIRGASMIESPDWLQQRLLSLGFRPKNIAVDVTNYVMSRCGQPLHAFDFDNIAGGKIIVRTALSNENFTTLDGKERVLNNETIMICDELKPIAIAGIMGGANSEITDSTTNIMLESAYFQPSSVRRAAKKLGLSTDASYRFERGVDSGNNIIYALDLAASMIAELGGGTIDSGRIDVRSKPMPPNTITLRYRRAEDLLGVQVDWRQMRDSLLRLGCLLVSETDETITVQSPSWRVDMELEIDLVEEIARLFFYDKIKPSPVYSSQNTTETAKEFISPRKRQIAREFLARRGFNQVINYNFTDAGAAALSGESVVELANPLGEEFAVMRASALPSMLRVISRNFRSGADSLALFEIGKVFRATLEERVGFVPGIEESETIIIAFAGNYEHNQWYEKSRSADFYDAKGAVEDLLDYLDFKVIFQTRKNPPIGFTINSAEVSIMSDTGETTSIGIVGEVSAEFREKFDISKPVFSAILNASKIYGVKPAPKRYEKISPYPEVERDAAFVLNTDAEAGSLLETVRRAGGDIYKSSSIFDVFSGGSLEEGKKSIGIRIKFSSLEKTLTEAEISDAMQNICDAVKSEFDGILRS